jgi:LytS/YehU family sensor histidine kinase
MAYFYANQFYFAPYILKKRGLLPFILTSVIVIVSISFVNSAFHHYYVEGRDMMPPPPDDFAQRDEPPLMFAGPTFASFLITTMVGLISSLLVFWEEWNKVQKEKQEQDLQRIAAELTALKLQISPHFLFNTLNNIRWLVRSKSDLAEDAVVKLSQLLRYILYQTAGEKVELKKELNHLRDFVELQKMRLPDASAMQWSVEGDVENKSIVPLLILPLVENFFKHGDFTGGFQNKINIRVTDKVLYFKTENKIDQVQQKEHGIGLTNVIKRLKLHYPDRHILKFEERDSTYFLELELILT